MIVGTVAAFVAYIASLTLADLRDLASYRLLSLGFGSLTLIGVAVYITSTVSRVLKPVAGAAVAREQRPGGADRGARTDEAPTRGPDPRT